MRLRPARASLTLVVLALVAAGCGGDPSPEERRDALVDRVSEDLQAETDGALDASAATCVAEGLADEVGVDGFDEVLAAAEGSDDPELRDQVIDVFARCDALAPLLDADGGPGTDEADAAG